MKSNRKFVAIILARGGSKEIKLKNIKLINNKPLLYWTIKSLKKTKLFSETWISSDNKKILQYSSKQKVSIIKRPKKLSNNNSSSVIGVLHAINYLNKKKNIIPKNIIFLQATSPIRENKSINNAIKYYMENNLDSLFSSVEIKDYYTWKKNKNKLVAEYNVKKRLPRQKLEKKFLENGSIYIFNKDKFVKEKSFFFGKVGTYVMKKHESFQLDDYEDLKIINSIMMNKVKN